MVLWARITTVLIPPKPTLNDPATGVSSAAKDRTYSPLESTPEGMEQSINFENNRGAFALAGE
jgi:hypothetical protein